MNSLSIHDLSDHHCDGHKIYKLYHKNRKIRRINCNGPNSFNFIFYDNGREEGEEIDGYPLSIELAKIFTKRYSQLDI